MTYKQISETYNLPLGTVSRRAHNLKLKGRRVGREKDLNESEVEELLSITFGAHLEKIRKNNHKRKLAIIEFYIRHGEYRKVSKMLNIHINAVSAAINEYNETGFVIVESRMNKEEV